MFADDTSLFSCVYDPVRSSLELNEDSDTVKLWAWQWEMHFKADKTEEVIFSQEVQAQPPNFTVRK